MASAGERGGARVVLRRDAAAKLALRIRRLEHVVEQLRGDLRSERELLRTALVELAQAQDSRETALFTRRWLRTHREA
jgi:hypothetical protein